MLAAERLAPGKNITYHYPGSTLNNNLQDSVLPVEISLDCRRDWMVS